MFRNVPNILHLCHHAIFASICQKAFSWAALNTNIYKEANNNELQEQELERKETALQSRVYLCNSQYSKILRLCL